MRLLLLVVLLAGVARGADVPLPGALLVVKPGKLVRFVARPAAGTTFTVPSPDDVTGPAGDLRILDLGATPGAGDVTLPLPGTWKPVGKRTRPTGFRYRGTGYPDNPCTTILLKKSGVKAVCHGSAVALTPPFAGDTAVLLTIASTTDRYCVTFGGKAVKNQVGVLKRTGALATGCPASVTTTTSSTSTSTTTATTVTTTTLPPGAHLVINEIDYDQVGTDTQEFVEVFNPLPTPAALDGLALVFVNGATGTEYLRVDLSPGAEIPAGECLVVSAASIVVPPTAVQLTPTVFTTGNAIQNGSPDGVLLLDTVNLRVLDALSYEGSITAATVDGVPGTVNLVEAPALPDSVADSNTVTGSLIRWPSGHDTDHADADWVFTTTPTPGAPNQLTP